MPPVEDLLRDLDRALAGVLPDRVVLQIFGSTALMLQVPYERGTKDSDVLETIDLTPLVRQTLLALAGRGTALHTKHRMFLEIVPNGVPFIPHAPRWHRARLTPPLGRLDIEVLDVVDVVVSKLKPFRPQDRDDIAAMIDGGWVAHAVLLDRFRAMVDRFAYDARADDLPKCVSNLHRVERDHFGVAPSEIELPSWI